MSSVRVALTAGLALLVLAIGFALLRSPLTLARTNGTPTKEYGLADTSRGASYCQRGELLPRGTTAIRFWLDAAHGPRVRVLVSADGHRITGGEVGSGWTSRVVTVPVRALPHDVSGATVCMSFQVHDETLTLFGKPAPSAEATYEGRTALPGTMAIEYLRPGTRSWASLIPSVFRDMGYGRAAPGPGLVFVALALLAAVVALASDLIMRELH